VHSLQTLAQQLTSPFPSPTDQARAIFTWLHHNIRYDTESFFAGNVQPSTPNSTLHSGLAVCEGYASLFTTLATHAGLESVVISGHGKGYGYTAIEPGASLPPYNAGHAWNAVRIDNGEWKLIDACWGAGHVQGAGMPYVPRFSPQYFTMPNEEFAIKHFPGNPDMFFLPAGRCMAWAEYISINPAHWPDMVEPPTIFSNSRPDYGVGERTVQPRSKTLRPAQGGRIRFSFQLECPHWTLDRHTKKGPPPVFILAVHGVDGREKDFLPLEHVPGRNSAGGDMWVADVEARQLGAPGQTLTLFAVTTFGDRQDARGLSVRGFREGKGRVGMGFSGVAAWELV
jgi:Transglutaminase-like superfamily